MKPSESNAPFITMADIRAAGGCAHGARAWFRHYGLDFRAFINAGGIDGALLLATGDAIARRVVELAMNKGLNDGQ